MMNRYNRCAAKAAAVGIFIMIAGMTTCLASGPHLATLIKNNSGRATGNVRYLASAKAYEIHMKGGKGTQRVMAADVRKVILKTQPPALNTAIANVKRGNYAAAIAPLKKIKTDYEMFGPDVTAAQYLAMAYLKLNKASEASRLCKSVMLSNPDAINDPQFAGVYWDALLAEKKYSTLKRLLGDIIKTGTHETAAVALVKRGDVLMAEGDSKAALLDGYLRTILMFQDVKAIQPEALYKAMKAHKAVNEHNYAEKWRKQLLAGYPTSEYAKKL